MFRGMATAFSAWAVRVFRAAAARLLLARKLSRTMQFSFAWWRRYTGEKIEDRAASARVAAGLARTPRWAPMHMHVLRLRGCRECWTPLSNRKCPRACAERLSFLDHLLLPRKQEPLRFRPLWPLTRFRITHMTKHPLNIW